MRITAEQLIDTMCVNKPERYKQMVTTMVEKADSYAKKAGGDLVSRQAIAWIMVYCDQQFVEFSDAEH